MTIEELKKRKLELEVDQLSKPIHKRSTFWLGIISVVLALAGVVAQGYLTNIKSTIAAAELIKAEKIKDKAENDTAILNQEKKRLQNEILTLEGTSLQLRKANDRLASISKTTELSSQNKIAVKKAENAKYSFGLYALNIDENLYKNVLKWIEGEGYGVRGKALLSTEPTWLAKHSTVLYYSSSTKTMAYDLSVKLKNLTEIDFKIKRGAGLGVGKGEEPWVFYIHIVDN